VGHSMGGLVSLQVACDHPGRVSGLLLTNAGGANVGPRRLQLILAVLGFRASSPRRAGCVRLSSPRVSTIGGPFLSHWRWKFSLAWLHPDSRSRSGPQRSR
jgi:pimeloyl-ACP methyl ester carboxylesterase